MVRIVKDASPTLDRAGECDCGHSLRLHRLQPAGCLALDDQDYPCACAEFRLADELPVAVRVKIIRDQLEIVRVILQDAQKRRLMPDEQYAVSQLARALVELTDAARSLLNG
jgi:hypothetical protein